MAATWTVPATVLRVIDADTIVLDTDLGFRVRYTATVRIDGIQAPELSTPEGRTARAHATVLLSPGTPVTLASRRWEKYGRVLGALTLPDGRDFAAVMLAAGYARPYA